MATGRSSFPAFRHRALRLWRGSPRNRGRKFTLPSPRSATAPVALLGAALSIRSEAYPAMHTNRNKHLARAQLFLFSSRRRCSFEFPTTRKLFLRWQFFPSRAQYFQCYFRHVAPGAGSFAPLTARRGAASFLRAHCSMRQLAITNIRLDE